MYVDKLYSGSSAIGIISELIITLLNTNVHTFNSSPVFTLIELETIKTINNIIGYDINSDGIFCPGGSYSNMLALLCARNKINPNIKKVGYNNKKYSIFMSEQGHYSIINSVIILGLGLDSVYKIKCDNNNKINLRDLENKIIESIKKNEIPLFINITAGTTVLGIFDNISNVYEISQKYKIWLHLDASWGGSVLMSDKYKYLLENCHLTDSITWNPHKMLGIPLQCSVLLIKDTKTLIDTTNIDVNYLYHYNQENNQENNLDLGKKTFQCGRKADAFKLWLSWRYYGKKGFETRINTAFDNVNYFINEITTKYNDNFILVSVPSFVNICFWYIPHKYNNILSEIKKDFNNIKKYYNDINEITKNIHNIIIKNGKLMIDYSDLPNGIPYFFRLIISSPNINSNYIDKIINEIIDSSEIVYGREK